MGLLALSLFLALMIAVWLSQMRPPERVSSDGSLFIEGVGYYNTTVIGVSLYRSVFERLYGLDVRRWHGKRARVTLVIEQNGNMRAEVQGRTVGHLPPAQARDCIKRMEKNNARGHATCSGRISVHGGAGTIFELRVDWPPLLAEDPKGRPA